MRLTLLNFLYIAVILNINKDKIMLSLKEYVNESILSGEKAAFDRADVELFLKTNYKIIGSYTIKETKSGFVVDVEGNIDLKNRDMEYLTNELFEFGKVDGIFSCTWCGSLKSLKGAPKKVGTMFNCTGCSSLTSLEGTPEEVYGIFNCSQCDSLKSLEGAPEKVGGDFDCSYCSSLKSLEGAPEKVGGNFNCRRYSGKYTEDDVKKYTELEGYVIA